MEAEPHWNQCGSTTLATENRVKQLFYFAHIQAIQTLKIWRIVNTYCKVYIVVGYRNVASNSQLYKLFERLMDLPTVQEVGGSSPGRDIFVQVVLARDRDILSL